MMARVRGARDERASDVHGEGTNRDKNRYFLLFVFWPSRVHGILRLYGRVYELPAH